MYSEQIHSNPPIFSNTMLSQGVTMLVPVDHGVQRVLHHLVVQSGHHHHRFQRDLQDQVGPVGRDQHHRLWIIWYTLSLYRVHAREVIVHV